MPRGTEVPITPEVLRWALNQSGFTDAQVAASAGVSTDILERWKDGTAKPRLTPFKKLAKKLHRPLAAFLLPFPPKRPSVSVEFRNITGQPTRPLNPTERRYLRRARRHQEVLAWLATELNDPTPAVPRHSLSESPEFVGSEVRKRLRIEVEDQQRWASPSQAFDNWRNAVEGLGVTVFLYALGEDSCNGFSLWDDRAPVIAISSAWREEARTFTLFHELGHLVTRSNSACLERNGKPTRPRDPVERWCEQFAAAVLLPRDSIQQFLPRTATRGAITDLRIASAVASRARISLRAATIRLIELGLAGWDLYEQIPSGSDTKTGGGGGTGRNRLVIKEDEFGGRGTRLFVEAVQKDVLSRSQAVGYLDIPDPAFDQLVHSTPPVR